MNLPGSFTEAKRIGATYYFTGRACKRGHITKRFTANGTCHQCQLQRGTTNENQIAYRKKYMSDYRSRLDIKERLKAYNKQYATAHKLLEERQNATGLCLFAFQS